MSSPPSVILLELAPPQMDTVGLANAATLLQQLYDLGYTEISHSGWVISLVRYVFALAPCQSAYAREWAAYVNLSPSIATCRKPFHCIVTLMCSYQEHLRHNVVSCTIVSWFVTVMLSLVAHAQTL